jgi:hypothetical protein
MTGKPIEELIELSPIPVDRTRRLAAVIEGFARTKPAAFRAYAEELAERRRAGRGD